MFEHEMRASAWVYDLFASVLVAFVFIAALPAFAFGDGAELEMGQGTELTVISSVSSEGAKIEERAIAAEERAGQAVSEDISGNTTGTRAGASALPKTGDVSALAIAAASSMFLAMVLTLALSQQRRRADCGKETNNGTM